MIEAFEIGVSLALRDGVEDRILKAQRDMATREHAMRTGGVSLGLLRAAATSALPAPAADPRGKVTDKVAARPVEDVDATPARAPEMVVAPPPFFDKQMAPAVEPLAPVMVPQLDAEQMATPGAAEAAAVTANIGPTVMAPDVDNGGLESVPPQNTQFFTIQAAHDAPVSIHETAHAPQAGNAPSLVVPAGHVGCPPTALFVAASFESGAPTGDTAGMPPAPSAPSPDTAPKGLDDPVRQGFRNAYVWEVDRSLGMASRTAFAMAPSHAGGQSAPAAPPAPQRDSGPGGGDVFLDGMLVGRWMSRFLQREGERASTGPTGFDPRRGRLLPGVTVGN